MNGNGKSVDEIGIVVSCVTTPPKSTQSGNESNEPTLTSVMMSRARNDVPCTAATTQFQVRKLLARSRPQRVRSGSGRQPRVGESECPIRILCDEGRVYAREELFFCARILRKKNKDYLMTLFALLPRASVLHRHNHSNECVRNSDPISRAE